MHFNAHLNLHRLLKTKKELEEIYINQIIRFFAFGMVGIFIPIYLINIGFSTGVSLLFMAVYFLFLGLISPVLSVIASKMGLKHIILYRTPGIILYLLMLIIIDPHIGIFSISMSAALLLPVAALGGFSSGLYWVSLNAEFVKNSDKIHRGEEVSHLIAFPKIAAIFAPFIGGVILNSMGFDFLFVLVIVLIAVSVLPLFITKDYRGYFGFRLSAFRLFLSRHLTARFFSEGFMSVAEIVLWPLYVFLITNDFITTGIAASISGLGIATFTLIVGKISNRVDRVKIIRFGGITYCIINLFRFFSSDATDIFLLSFLGGIFYTLVRVNLYTNFCDYAKKRNILGTVSFREFWISSGRILTLLIAIILLPGIEAIFIIVAAISLVHSLF